MIGGSAAFLRYSKAASGGFMLYGFGKFFGASFREIGLAHRCRPFLVWLCLVPSFSAALDTPYPWNPFALSDYIPLGRTPTRYYTEADILSLWTNDSRVISAVPFAYRDSIESLYDYLAETSPHDVTPPVLTAETSSVFNLSVEESYLISTNQLLSVNLAPTVSKDGDLLFNSVFFPGFLASWYGFGYVSFEAGPVVPSRPPFGGEWGSGYAHDFGFFTTNNMVTRPWSFQDWQEPGPLVWRRQDAPAYLNRSSAWFSGGTLRAYHVHYAFPEIPNMGNRPESGVYPVRPSVAFSFLDEYWLPWYWQTLKGLVVWDTSVDSIKVKNVLRFSSPSNSTDGAR